MTCLADVNVWIALAAEHHFHHPAARRWFQALRGEKFAFCRITQMGFLRCRA
jgi:predicted nucleic acid-binding protein